MRRPIPWMLLFGLLAASAVAQDVDLLGDFSWGSRYRAHHWTPVRVTIQNRGEGIEGILKLQWASPGLEQGNRRLRFETLEDRQGMITEIPVHLPKASRRAYTAYVLAPEASRMSPSLWITVQPDEGDSIPPFEVIGRGAQPRPPFCVIMGQVLPPGLRGIPAQRLETAVSRPDLLPDRWMGYAAVDGMIWTDADASTPRDTAQIEALEEWVHAGGHLVVARSDPVGVAGTFLEELLPVELTYSETIPRLEAFWEFPNGKVSILNCVPREGARVTARQGERPLMVEKRLGRGRVTFLAFDPNQGPFAEWSGMAQLWTDLLGAPPAPERDPNRYYEPSDTDTLIGSTTLNRAAFEFPGVRPPSLGWVFWVLLLYILLVGPVDYFVLRRLRRQEWTWFTFPTYVLAFSSIAVLGAIASARQAAIQREMVFIDVTGGREHGWAIGGFLTPTEQVTGVQPGKGRVAIPVAVGSYGYGGIQSIEHGARVRHEEGLGFVECGVDRGETAVVSLEWAEKVEPRLSFSIEGTTLRTRNRFGATLRDVYLFHDGKSYLLPDVPPGAARYSSLKPARTWNQQVRLLVGKQDLGAPWEPSRDHYYRGYRGGGDSAQFDEERRKLVLGLAFAGALTEFTGPGYFSGPARRLDATDWIESGGSVLFGWLDSDGVIEFEGQAPRRSAQVLVRAFSR